VHKYKKTSGAINRIHQLGGNTAFKDLDDSDLEVIARTFRYRLFPEDYPIVEQDRKTDYIGLIVRGAARIVIRDRYNREQVCGCLDPGQFMIDISLLIGHTAVSSIISNRPLICLMQHRTDFLDMIKTHPALKDFFYCVTMQNMWESYRIICGNDRIEYIRPAESDRVPKNIIKSLALIDQFYSNPLTLDQIARESGMSRYHFSRVFKSYTGHSFKEYLNHKRIEAAKHLMTQEGMNVSQACFRVGYNNVSYFSQLFKSHEGMLPSTFLKNKKK
jgi:AraC-like DNA-binding protein